MKYLPLLSGVVAASCLLATAPAQANERHFTYTYETAVMAPDARELELWTTWRAGRDSYYTAFDHRLEFEVGLTDRLLTAFYLNFGAVTQETESGVRETTFEHKGVSSEWKYQLTHPQLDPIGFGLYAELSAGTSEYEIEGKLLFDKRIGPFLIAANLVGELEWEIEDGETEREIVLAPVMGATWFPTPGFGVGVELRSHNDVEDGEWEHSALHAGPVLSYARGGWWTALTIFPQIAGLKGASADSNLVLDGHERVEVRLMVASEL